MATRVRQCLISEGTLSLFALSLSTYHIYDICLEVDCAVRCTHIAFALDQKTS